MGEQKGRQTALTMRALLAVEAALLATQSMKRFDVRPIDHQRALDWCWAEITARQLRSRKASQ